MSNRFCIFLNEGSNLFTFKIQAQDKLYPLKQGHLLIIGDTPYSAYHLHNETWHIIGHIDNLHLLNYLLFSYYPSNNEIISKEIVFLAIKRYGMRILELLSGNFCVVYEDKEGNLTLVTEGNTPPDNPVPAVNATAECMASGPVAAAGEADAAARQAPHSYAYVKDNGRGKAMACHQPANHYRSPRQISITSWHDNQLQFFQSFRSPHFPPSCKSVEEQYDDGIQSMRNHSLMPN